MFCLYLYKYFVCLKGRFNKKAMIAMDRSPELCKVICRASWPKTIAGRSLKEGHPRNISTKLFKNLPHYLGEDFFSFHYSYIRIHKQPDLWGAMFFYKSTWLERIYRVSPKKHFYKLFKNQPDHDFRRRFFKKF